MDTDEPLTHAQAEAILEYAQLTYTAVTSWRRRLASVALIMATVVGLMCAFSATRWLSTRSELADIPDEALIDVMGVEIPDPRPALERAQLRVVSLLWGFGAGLTGAITLLFLALHALARPPAGPGGRRRPALPQPPM